MKKVGHASNTRTLAAPGSWDHRQVDCDALPVTDTKIGNYPAMKSYWQPTPSELERLNAGGSVVLWVISETHPPVAVEVEP